MRKIFFYLFTLILILIWGNTGLTQGLPSLTESNSTLIPSTTNINSPAVTPSVSAEVISVPNIYSYTDSEYSFTFNYPETWEPYEDIDASGTYKAEVDLLEGDYIIAAFAVYAEKFDSSLANYAISVEEWMMDPQNMPEYSKVREEAVTIGGLPAIKRFYTWTKTNREDNSKIPIKAVDVYLVKDNKGYILEGQTIREKFEQILPQLEAIINSFSLNITTGSITSESGITSAVTTPGTPSVSTATSTSEGIAFKFCPYCGMPLEPDYKFCPGCGKPIGIQRSAGISQKQEVGIKKGNQINLNYLENFTQTRGFSEELNQNDYLRGRYKNNNQIFNSFEPIFISQNLASPLANLFPQEPILPWTVSRRIMSEVYNYGKVFPNALGKKISSHLIANRNLFSEKLNFSYLEELGKSIVLNPDSKIIFRGETINAPLGSVFKNLGSITSKMSVTKAPLSMGSWVLKGVKRGVEDNSMGSAIKNLNSRIGMVLTEKIRTSLLGESLSILGRGISSEIGIPREGDTLPSLSTVPQQTTPALPTIPPATGSESIISQPPGATEQGGITLTPPGQPVPSQPSPGGIALPTPGVPQQPEIIWKQYSLNQAFGHNPIITGYIEYPSTWLVNLDSFNRNVTFSEDSSGLTALTLFPGLMGQFSSAQDLAQQMSYLLQQQVPDLSILNQEFKIIPTPGGGAIELTEGKVNLQGTYQGTVFRFDIETFVMYTGVYGPVTANGYVILTQAPQNVFQEKDQKYFNRMKLSYKRAIGRIQ
ncbi:MAG: hypothetical protein Kow00103_03300 [Candidatus Caldatribacteriota bacterium]